METFLKAPFNFVQTLLLAVGIDANGKNLLLAWAVVESENKESWIWLRTVPSMFPGPSLFPGLPNYPRGRASHAGTRSYQEERGGREERYCSI